MERERLGTGTVWERNGNGNGTVGNGNGNGTVRNGTGTGTERSGTERERHGNERITVVNFLKLLKFKSF